MLLVLQAATLSTLLAAIPLFGPHGQRRLARFFFWWWRPSSGGVSRSCATVAPPLAAAQRPRVGDTPPAGRRHTVCGGAGGVSLSLVFLAAARSMPQVPQCGHIVHVAGHTAPVACFVVDNGDAGGAGARVVSGSWDNTVRVWDVDTQLCVATLFSHTSWVTSLTVFENRRCGPGVRVVSGSPDRTARVRNLAVLPHVATSSGHIGGVTCFLVVGDIEYIEGVRLVSGFWDTTVRVRNWRRSFAWSR